MQQRQPGLLQRYLHWEEGLTLAANRLSRKPWVRRFFSAISRLGNGWGWAVILSALLLIDGREAVLPIVWMMVTTFIGTGLYWSIKRLAARPRPIEQCQRIVLSEPPLDQFSFPSGHTLHAVNFTLQILFFAPMLGWIAVPFALLIAASRLILGLHYLSDVLVGAVLGMLLATFALAFRISLM
ncbi:phosphatase PAP2 family protein [Thiomonas sp.]